MDNANKSLIIFTDKFPYSLGENFFNDELSFLIQGFSKITIIPFEKGNTKNIREIPKSINLIQPVFNSVKNKKELIIRGIFNFSFVFPFINEIIVTLNNKKTFSFYNWLVYVFIIRTLLTYIRKGKLTENFKQADILYFYWGLRWSQVIPFISDEFNSKIVVRFHGSDLYENLNRNYIPHREVQLRQLKLAVCVSEMGKNYLSDRYPFLKGKVIVGRLGTFDYGLNPFINNTKIHIVSCSNLVPVKRVHLIAQSLMYFNVNIKWTHIGGGSQMNEIRDLVKDLPENIETELTGSMSHGDLLNFYKTCPVHVFLNVSSSEGVPVSVMEALSFGIPVLATNAGGTSEIVNDMVGLLLDIKITPQELSSKIMSLIYNEQYLNFRINARNQWENLCRADIIYPEFIHTLKNMATGYKDL